MKKEGSRFFKQQVFHGKVRCFFAWKAAALSKKKADDDDKTCDRARSLDRFYVKTWARTQKTDNQKLNNGWLPPPKKAILLFPGGSNR